MPYNINSGYGAVSAHSVTGASGPIGKTFHVCKAGSNAYAYLSSLYPVDSDGVVRVYAADGVADEVEIQAAIDAAKGGTNAYVFVYAGAYTLAAAITMAGKSSLHLVGVNGGGCDVGCVGAAALTQGGSCAVVIMEAYGELTGFQIINKAGYPAVTMADGKWRANIHHNYFHMTQGTACNIIDCAGTGMAHGYICNNKFQTYVGGAITSAITVYGAFSVTIANNWINNHSGTMDVGIELNSSAQAMIVNNIVSDDGGAGTITVAIALGGGAMNTAINNRVAVLSGRGFTGGTVNRSFVDNRDATAGGETCIET